jgi:TRAP-type C4-dicarboxylate transport system permease small subunit
MLMLGVCWLLFRGALEQTKINWDVSAPSSGTSMGWFYSVGMVFSVSSAVILLNDLFKLLAGKVSDADLIIIKESEDQE